MSCFYLKGIAPPQVDIMQIFKGALPFCAMVIVAMIILYMFPGIALWLPAQLYN
jgi:TRAP-type mannitol/chloroaromatic compound transport system permease large subunit